MSSLDHNHFEQHLNQSCTLHDADGNQHAAELVEVKKLRPPDSVYGEARSQPFSVLLKVKTDERLPDSIMTVEGEGLNEELFLVAVDQYDDHFVYEAVFT